MDESLTPKIIRIATRKSPLALWQAQMVGQQIKKIDETIESENELSFNFDFFTF